MNTLKTNLFFKIGTIIVIMVLLLIPTSMIRGLITEREETGKDAVTEVSAKWGEEQTLIGPYLSVPYTKYTKETSSKTGEERIISSTEYLYFLPEDLTINGDLIPEKRYRGIYEIVVYNSKIKLTGTFNGVSAEQLGIAAGDVHFDRAHLNIGIDDLRGIEKQVSLQWNGEASYFNPGLVGSDIAVSGINASVAVDSNGKNTCTFSFELELKGSQLLYFTPVGKVTDINVSSKWADPGFNGAFLPDRHSVTPEGFSANWNILHLNRNFPQSWKGSEYSVRKDAFGVDLLLPVDSYQKTYRSIHYAILFIAFTFLVFFFIEVMQRVFIHPIQYLLVGLSLVVFYTLLLSISEFMKFNYAFILSAAATILLITLYVKAILRSLKLMFLISGILLILYTFIFIVIQLQDMALLIGSIGIFFVLCLVMYFSRKIDWYDIAHRKQEE